MLSKQLLCSSGLDSFDLIYCKNTNIVKYFLLNLFNFQKPLLQLSVSHNPSEIIMCWFDAQEKFCIIVNVEDSCAA